LLYRKKRSKFKLIVIKVLCLLVVLSVSVFCLFEFKARDLVHNLVDNELEIHAMNAIDEAVLEALMNSEVDKLPLEILGHLPPWCIYVPILDGCRESTGLDKAVAGVFFYYGVANTKESHSGKSGFSHCNADYFCDDQCTDYRAKASGKA